MFPELAIGNTKMSAGLFLNHACQQFHSGRCFERFQQLQCELGTGRMSPR